MITPDGIETPEDVENSCANCKRYIGPIVTCPFCGHRTKRRSVIGVTKNAALVVAVVGLLVLHIWSMSYGVPTMDIEDLSETANYAYVEISGFLPRAPVYYPGEHGGAGTIYFTVDDGTQQISVRAYPNPVVEDMLETGKIPAFGDRVNVSGNVYWYNAERGFILNSLEQLDIFRPEEVNMTISEINDLEHESMDGYYRVKTFGTVSSWRKFDFAVDISIIDEHDNEVSVYIPGSVYDLTGLNDLGRLEIGMGLEVIGCLEYYDAGSYSKWEIIPATTAEIKMTQPDLAITDIEVSPLTFPLNQQFYVNVTVTNNGDLPVTNAELLIQIDGQANYTKSDIYLGAGDSYIIWYSTSIMDGRTSLEITATFEPLNPLIDYAPDDNTMIYTGGS